MEILDSFLIELLKVNIFSDIILKLLQAAWFYENFYYIVAKLHAYM